MRKRDPGWSYFSCNLVRFGAKSRCTTSTCSSHHCAARHFAQLLDFIERLDVRRVNLREKYDYPDLLNDAASAAIFRIPAEEETEDAAA